MRPYQELSGLGDGLDLLWWPRMSITVSFSQVF